MKYLYLIMVVIPFIAGAQFLSTTMKKIDIIENNTGTDIILKPVSSVKVDTLTGNFALQSGAAKELEESTVTSTELSYVSGVTSAIQGQIDGKEPTLPNTTDGDLLYYNSGQAALAIGTNEQYLRVSSLGFPEWADFPTVSPLTTKGDLYTYDTDNQRLPVGADNQILSANSAIATGLEWIDPPSTSPTTTLGDLILRGATEDERLPIGAVDTVLTSDGTTASWETAPVSLPDQTGEEGKFLTTDGTNASWDDTITGLVLQANEFARIYIPASGNGGCEWFDGTTNRIVPVSDPDCGDAAVGGEIIGNILMPDTKVPSFTLQNVVVGNVYTFNVSHIVYADTGDTNVNVATYLNIGGTGDKQTIQHFKGSSSGTFNKRKFGQISWTATIAGDVSVQYKIQENVANRWQLDTRLQSWEMSVKEFPAKADTVAVRRKSLRNLVAGKTTAQTLTSNVITPIVFDFVTEDTTGGLYNNTTGIFTCPVGEGTVVFYVDYSVYLENLVLTGSNTQFLAASRSDGLRVEQSRLNNTTGGVGANGMTFGLALGCEDGMTWSFDALCLESDASTCSTRAAVGATFFNSISIQERPENVIIAGLDSKCQSKFLSADVSTNGVLTDLGFSGLTGGKSYRLRTYMLVNFANAGNDNVSITYHQNAGADLLCQPTTAGSNAAQASAFQSCLFTSDGTDIVAASISIAAGNNIRGIGGITETYAELCETSTLTTTEW